jgi:hypothetical protein
LGHCVAVVLERWNQFGWIERHLAGAVAVTPIAQQMDGYRRVFKILEVEGDTHPVGTTLHCGQTRLRKRHF